MKAPEIHVKQMDIESCVCDKYQVYKTINTVRYYIGEIITHDDIVRTLHHKSCSVIIT